ncbi:MAG TPA: 50S ribosomal protein L29 [Porphyromonadaceae bacterium]|jgi:large subunit ribosomal protein L29|uniref:50S ribosomal protein L29 n=1 Tax=Duncaniella muris TaxID=2094150 RepID=UPI000A98D6F2|nr:50S ribosomal protein L29 [Duncaniella muris]MCX4259719.1 50S ribosomal protein L29 [Muribaculaceae bacterium]GFI05501.1 50S ribosomal protein L29 [Muribaculaceae bacterium]HAB40348.1 50S ribosomal protein L29 [Porphyromonadaceae bacterium]
MKKEEIKEMTTADLRERLAEMQKAYRQLVATHAVSTIDNPAQITKDRRMIARVLTELRAREIAAK